MRHVLLSKRDTYLSGLPKRHSCVMRLIQSLVINLKTNMVRDKGAFKDPTTTTVTLEEVSTDYLQVTASLSE